MRRVRGTFEEWIGGLFYSLDFEWDPPRILPMTLYVDGREMSLESSPDEVEYLSRKATRKMLEGT